MGHLWSYSNKLLRLFGRFRVDSAVTKELLRAILLIAIFLSTQIVMGQTPRFRAVVFYSTTVEGDHVQFANNALAFLSNIASKDRFEISATTNWDDLNDVNLGKYQLVVWLNDSPTKREQRASFQRYMERGGA